MYFPVKTTPLGSITSDWGCVANEKRGSAMMREDFTSPLLDAETQRQSW